MFRNEDTTLLRHLCGLFTFVICVSGCGGAGGGSDTGNNVAPLVVEIDVAASVNEGDSVQLSAHAQGGMGTDYSFSWRQVSGPDVVRFEGVDNATAQFVAPNIALPERIEIEVVARNESGEWVSSTVDISVLPFEPIWLDVTDVFEYQGELHVGEIHVDALTHGTVYLGSELGNGSGLVLDYANGEITAKVEGAEALIGVPGDPKRLFALKDGEVLSSADGGTIWDPIASHGDFAVSNAHFLRISSDGLALYLSSNGKNSFVNAPEPGVAVSYDAGVTWTTPAGADNYRGFGLISSHVGKPEVTFAVVDGREIYKSSDYGASWIKTNAREFCRGADLEVGSKVIGALGGVSDSGDCQFRLALSGDEGGSWEYVEVPPQDVYPEGYAFCFDPTNDQVLYLAVSFNDEHLVKSAAVYRSEDLGQSWQLLNDQKNSGLPAAANWEVHGSIGGLECGESSNGDVSVYIVLSGNVYLLNL